MEEVSKTNTNYRSSIMKAVYGPTIRSIVDKANNLEIKRDNIVSLLKENGQYVLLYY